MRRTMWSLFVLSMIATPAAAGPHLFFDDDGAVNWKPSWQAALEASRTTGKPLFIHISRDDSPRCKDLAETTLRDAQVKRTIKRHFIAVVLDARMMPPELAVPQFTAKLDKKPLPALLYLTDRGQDLHVTTDFRSAADMQADLTKALENKAIAIPKAQEAKLTKEVEALEKNLENKKYEKAMTAWKAIQQVRGYSPEKDKAYDLLDAVQEEGTKKLQEALAHVHSDEYAEAKKTLESAAKDYSALPIAKEAKEHVEAVKLLEAVHKLTSAEKKKLAWKQDAIRQLDQVGLKYGDTPYAAVAQKRKAELQK